MTPSRRHILAFAAVASLLPRCALAAETAEAFLNGIYGLYQGTGNGVALDTPEAIQRYFEPGLAKLMIDADARAAAVDDIPQLDGDPFVDAQDWDISKLKVAVDPNGADAATGHVSFDNSGEMREITLDLVRTSDGWRIADIHWSEGTLRGLYDQ